MNYLQLHELCQKHFPDLEASQLAGMIHGLFGHGFVVETGLWPQHMADFLTSGEPLEKDALQGLENLMAFAQKDYQLDSFSIDLLIPEEDYALTQQVRGVGEWCQGFLTGYGLIKQKKELEGEAKEALQDLAEISQIDFEIDDADSDELEGALVTVTEHVKMSAHLIYLANQSELEPTVKEDDKPQQIH